MPGSGRQLLKSGIVAGLLLILQACTTMPSQPSLSSSVFRQNASLSEWELRGKVGIKTPRGADSAYLNWRQCGNRYDIRINGPLGSGAARLIGDDEQVTLFADDQPPVTAASAEHLLWQQFGWQLPVSQLSHWIKGIPSPGHPSRPDTTGFRQLGWTLSYPRQTAVQGFQLPAKAVATSTDLKVTLILQQWRLQADCGASS